MNFQNFEKFGFKKISNSDEIKNHIQFVFEDNFGKELGNEIPYLISEVAKTDYEKLLQNPNLFNSALDEIFRDGAARIKNQISKKQSFQKEGKTVEKAIQMIEESQNIHVVSLFFEEDKFRDNLVKEYLQSSQKHKVTTAFFGKTEPPMQVTSSRTYQQVILDKSILHDKVQENISNAVSQNNSDRCSRICCQETSIFKEHDMFSQYLDLLKGIDQIKNDVQILFCFRKNILEESEIEKIASASDVVILDSKEAILERGETN